MSTGLNYILFYIGKIKLSPTTLGRRYSFFSAAKINQIDIFFTLTACSTCAFRCKNKQKGTFYALFLAIRLYSEGVSPVMRLNTLLKLLLDLKPKSMQIASIENPP